MKEWAEVINELQVQLPQLVLCGSVALMLHDLLDRRNPSDIDFVLTEKDIPYFALSLREDKYLGNDNYRSFHCKYLRSGKSYSLNLLVFTDDTVINTEVFKYGDNNILAQKVDDILFWKKDYDRKKDRDDLDNIANNIIEKHYLRD